MRGLFATIVLLLGSVFAFAQPVPVPVQFNEYSAKFLCGEVRDATEGVRPGTYETSINIHNPQFPLPPPPPVPHEFDVVGVYTVDTPQGSISLEMVPIAARTVSFPWPEGTQLRDDLLREFQSK